MSTRLPEDFSLICDFRSEYPNVTTPEQLRWIKYSVQSGNYYIFRNKLEQPVGYAIWAKVCRETLARLVRTGVYPQYYYEWNEGRIPLLLDLFMIDRLTLLNRIQLNWVKRRHKALSYVRRGRLVLRFSEQSHIYMLPSDTHQASPSQ